MIPSTLAAEVTRALEDFLATGFGPSNPAFASVMDDFLGEGDNLVKGPYLSIDLPFQRAAEGGEPFPALPLGFAPWRHQRIAFERLRGGESTIVATGTGSGKTECFLYPILDHCLAQAGTPGVKAILVYPMNALATDQAGRIARLIHGTEALRGKVSAGLYVGETGASDRERMTEAHLVENREAMRQRPPDILLTNYKMLDLLLTRPMDFPLWRHNEAGTLRFLVVDELHTFDGAQGTDLACLVRRLRTRLQANEGLVCVGTSATLGGLESRERIIAYASSLFHQPFGEDAIVGETRQGINEFLGDALTHEHLSPWPDLAGRVDPNRYPSADAYARAQHEVFFGEPAPEEFHTPAGRAALGVRLREHAAFVNLLRVLHAAHPTPVADVLARLQRSLQVSSAGEAMNVLNALCALISTARDAGGRETETESGDATAETSLPPFLTVKLHLWVRELRRMVCSVWDEPETPIEPNAGEADAQPTDAQPTSTQAQRHRLRHSDDLKPDEDFVHLPLVQCRECHVTAWAAVKRPGETKVSQDLRVFYNRFFLRDPEVLYLFPLAEGEERPPGVGGEESFICGACGTLGEAPSGTCRACGSTAVVRVFQPRSVNAGRDRRPELSRDCPHCQAREALIILGARASSLLSTGLAQLFASHHNDDRKVIAFSDNVQDAAHRGSFFAARTWRNGVRMAIAQVVEEHDGVSLAELPDKVVDFWSDTAGNPKAFDEKRFISEFIAPDKMWWREFEALRENGSVEEGSNLLEWVKRRLRWDTQAELTFAGSIGRTLERTQTAAVGFDPAAVAHACDTLLTQIREGFGELRTVQDVHVRSLVMGTLRRMKDRGAVENPALNGYLRSGGNPFAIQDRALQNYGPRSGLPVFPAPIGDGRGVEAITSRRKSWYQTWVEKVLSTVHLLAATSNAGDILRMVMTSLVRSGLARSLPARNSEVWALDPARLYVTPDVVSMEGPHAKRPLVVPVREAPLWQGVPSLEVASLGCYEGHKAGSPSWAGRLYRQADIHRIVSAEHTALVSREDRDRLQTRFASPNAMPWEPNLLSATPTLELGVDIGDLSTVVMCSVPPAPVNYQQRAGRAGRRDGNALALTVATGQPHDLYYYEEPMQMLGSSVDPPGIFLNAPAVLERQLTAFCFDCWVAGDVGSGAVPRNIGTALNHVAITTLDRFPHPLLDFIRDNAEELLHGFLVAFETRSAMDQGLDEASRDYLGGFLLGTQERNSLRHRVLSRLTEAARERQSLRNDAEALTRRIRALQQGAPDDATQDEIKKITRERAAIRDLVGKLGARDTFGFLTDEGLLPNYAFPEAPVTLRSVIFKESDGDEGDDDAVVYEYVRPAVSALGEFAPENEFYAGGRRVEIRRVDTRVSPIEIWRLCPSCDYAENIETGDRSSACPACGDPQWADAGQRREMLPLKVVHAATPDRSSRIMDERDDREPLFYVRELAVTFPPEAVGRAFACGDAGQPFGFEYIAKATFRDMNFGRVDEQEAPVKFAGDARPRKGFSVCRRCGGVQDRKGEVQHTFTCRHRDDSHVVDCLYLYRQFDSEGIRVLVPPIGSLDEDERLHSFIAALELGLKRRFAGAVDHLRATISLQPAEEESGNVKFLMLYDTVPSGTGYLKQMMNRPEQMLEVLRQARDALAGCSCNSDPEKDGCYRCLYAYRRSHEMASISRKVALRMLDTILEQADTLEEVDGLRSVKVNPALESELEARFVQALRHWESAAWRLQVRDDVVAGKPGYVLTVGEMTYTMEAQAQCGASEGVAIASRPDFVIRATREAANRPPVAVFMDGFEFHRDTLDEDSAKRMALVRAGYLVWSLTWHDLEPAFGNEDDCLNLLGGSGDHMADLQRRLDVHWGTGAVRSGLEEPSLGLLVHYLAAPDALAWKRAVFTRLLPMFEPATMQDGHLEERVRNLARQLPDGVQDAFSDLPVPAAFALRGERQDASDAHAELALALPLAAVEAPEPDALLVALHVHDQNLAETDGRRAWNGVLRLYNLLQFVPGAWWTTALGVERGNYASFGVVSDAELPDSWAEAVTLADSGLRETLLALADAGVPTPEVGFELADAAGRVVAEAELAWPDSHVAALLAGESATPFEQAGWQAFPADLPDLLAKLASVLQTGLGAGASRPCPPTGANLIAEHNESN